MAKIGTIGKPVVPLAPNGTIGKITNGAIGKTPNRATVKLANVLKASNVLWDICCAITGT